MNVAAEKIIGQTDTVFIVRYAGDAIKFVENACGKHIHRVDELDATKFESIADAERAIAKFHISGRAYVEKLKA